ncbi:MAG: secondary thiamine-phosphate synthase enzyme YjbQ [Minisyncoccia bacterium]
MEELKILSQKKVEIIDITFEIKKEIEKRKIKDGIVIIFIPHTTCGLILTENEPNLKKDFLDFFQEITKDFDFAHNKIDDNAQAHLLSAILGQEKTLIIKENKLVLGTWQSICLVELDGPRERKIYLKFLSENW